MAKRRFSRDAWRRRASHDAFHCVSPSDTAFDVFIADLLFPYLPKYAKRVSDQPHRSEPIPALAPQPNA